MKNVMFVVPDFYPNSTGFANATLNLIETIRNYGKEKYRIGVFSTIPLGDKKELKGIEIMRYCNTIPDNRITHIFVERKKYNMLCKFIDDFNADVIFFETNTFPFLQSWIVKKFRDKVFVRIHSTADTEVPIFGKHRTILDRYEYKKMKNFMVNVSNILSTSSYYLDFIKKYYLNENVYSIWNDKTYNVLYNTSGDVDNSIYIQKKNIFMTMGKMSDNGVTQKGITDLLKAVYYLKKEKKLPNDFKLIIIGTGIKLGHIKGMIENLNLKSDISLIEYASHEEVFRMIRNCKAIVLLSRYEGQSMFITESISMGKPLILSDNNGMQDMLVPGVNGYCVKTGDFKQAAEAIEKMMSLEEKELENFSKASIDIYNASFSAKAVYNQFDEIMELYFSQY